ncbi:Dna2/Cas4 domain-containing protein, partial [Spirulina subsalsa FACHB-351]
MQAIDLDLSNVLQPAPETLRVCSLHAFAYCPRLFYLEEVEELYTQDAAVFAGRRLHEGIELEEGEEWQDLYLEDECLGLRGRVDALRSRDGKTIPYELDTPIAKSEGFLVQRVSLTWQDVSNQARGNLSPSVSSGMPYR